MIQALIDIAKDIKASAMRGEAEGMSDDELAFYDALAQNNTAVEAMGNEQLRIIAHELLDQVRRNATVDWHKKESARAKMRILVRRILRKYGYPPDLSKEAIQIVLEQAEALLHEITCRETMPPLAAAAFPSPALRGRCPPRRRAPGPAPSHHDGP